MPATERKFASMITRAQPWHAGHQRYLEEMAANNMQPVIFLGSSNADRDRAANPFNTMERTSIINSACENLFYPDGSRVKPLFVPIYDFERTPHEKPYVVNGEKFVPLNRKWFAQFTKFFEDNNIDPADFTLYYAAKEKDKKNYVFGSVDMPWIKNQIVARHEDLSYAFTLLGMTRKEMALTEINATDIRKDFEGNKHLLAHNGYETIKTFLDFDRQSNAEYDGHDISDESYNADPMQVLYHERRTRHDYLHKRAEDPGFHKRVLVVGTEGALSTPIIESLLAAGHDVILSSSKDGTPWTFAKDWTESRISRLKVDLRDPETGNKDFWSNLYVTNNVDAVINLAGIISEKPEEGLTFEAINYRAVPAMAQACVACGIDRYIYFSTLTAAAWEAQENAQQTGRPLTYAGSKRKAEMALEQLSDKLNWFSIRPVTTYDPFSADWGRPMSLPDLANLPVVPVWGSGQQQMQPVNLWDLAKISRLVESNQQGGQILDVVGPESLTLETILRTLRRLKGDFAGVNIPYDRALRLADNYPIGGINRSFIRVMSKREQAGAPQVDSKPWTKAVGERKLASMSEVYNNMARSLVGTAGQTPLPLPKPPVLEYARQIAAHPDEFYSLLSDSGADAALMESVSAVFEKLAAGQDPGLSAAEASDLLKKVIMTLGSEEPFELTP